MTTTAFLAALSQATRQLLATVHTEFAPLELSQLNQQPAPAAWSILECLEHLNRYSRYYNPRLAQALAQQPGPTAEAAVGYSWLGRKFIGMMAPGSTKKAKTLKHMNPQGSRLGREVLAEFTQQQEHLLDLLARAQQADLNRKAVPVEFLKLLRMRLGEAFEFVVLHEQRHVQQALRAKASLRTEAAPGAYNQAAAPERCEATAA
ncbi:DinB family protein [Hymenobacter sp. BT664]|uniref:DinB family protein n=1 Tax=Hymenobacter montanus TaxID=2771359 RepID=A0A927BG26_9BACT|nr:DinB family protein [Hymenobacter montanus]MBD2769786.1 DinB family protein [Hymenobacter montanus]